MKTKFKLKENQIIWIIILMYSIVIYKFIDSSRALETYFDELIYYDIAKSIAQGDIFKVHGVSMDFTNIAYSLVISPFCLISDTVLRIHLISYLNALLMSISIYPVWLICKELNVKKEISWLIVSIVMVYPGMLISKTFMSENLYWPLTLFTYYYIIKMIKYRKLSYSIISGVLAYFCYLCKEVGLCIILATIAFMILDPIDSYLYENNKEKSFVKCLLEKFDWKNILGFTIIFVILRVIANNLFFTTIQNGYESGLSISAENFKMDIVLFMIYAIIYYLVYVIIAFWIFPILYPLFMTKKMDKVVRKAYFYILILLLGTIITIVYTMTIYEDIGNTLIRVHMRYFNSIIGVILPIFGASITYPLENKKRNQIWIGLVLFSIICFGVFKGVTVGSVPESLELYYYAYLTNRLGTFTIGNYTIYKVGLICSSIILIVTIMLYIINRKKHKISFAIWYICVLIICILNINKDVELVKAYYVPPVYIADMQQINSYFEENNLVDKNVMFICDQWYSKNPKVYDTYFIGNNAYEMRFESLNGMISNEYKDIDIENSVFHEAVKNLEYNLPDIEYFIVSNEVSGFNELVGNIEYINDASSNSYAVYKNLDKKKICSKKTVIDTIVFKQDGYNASSYNITGMSKPEEFGSWTDGNQVHVEYEMRDDGDSIEFSINLAGTYNGNQRYIVCQNENEIVSGEVCGNDNIVFEIEGIDGYYGFDVYLPDAVSPKSLGESEDIRNLALAISSITINRN